MSESYLIMKHRERQRRICSAPQIFKVPLWPWWCWERKKKQKTEKNLLIISVIPHLSGHQTRPPTVFQARLQGDAFVFLTENHTPMNRKSDEKRVTILTNLLAKWSFWSAKLPQKWLMTKPPNSQISTSFIDRIVTVVTTNSRVLFSSVCDHRSPWQYKTIKP